jgi:pimeloyl-ACP methyl ester carboxylesterase
VELARRHFPYCGVELLLKHRFDALRFASLARAPALVLLADQDDVIPKHHAMRFVDAWGGAKQVTTISHSDHANIQAHPSSWQAIAAFLKQQFADPM